MTIKFLAPASAIAWLEGYLESDRHNDEARAAVACLKEQLTSSETAQNEGYPGIAHDLEMMRTALVEIRDECFSGAAYDIAERALNDLENAAPQGSAGTHRTDPAGPVADDAHAPAGAAPVASFTAECTSPRSTLLLALDRMVESVEEDIKSEDPGNHATLGMLRGELKGLMAARTYAELDEARWNRAPSSIERIQELERTAAEAGHICSQRRRELEAREEEIKMLRSQLDEALATLDYINREDAAAGRQMRTRVAPSATARKDKAWGDDPDQLPCETMGQCHRYASACVEQGRAEYKDKFIAAVNELTGVLCFPDDIELFWERINRSTSTGATNK